MPKKTLKYETKTYDRATKFLADLSPSSSLWYPRPDRWIFRGQRDANWRLIPSAFRPESWRSFGGLVADTEWTTNQMCLGMETNAVCLFAEAADRQGLPVPGFDESWLGHETRMQKFSYDLGDVFCGKQKFPLPHWRPLFGMAQHYGIPTRLLDWSESAKIAAYFATVEAAGRVTDQSSDAGEFLAVWALDIERLESITQYKPERFVSVRAPWSSNPNLLAQKGLFTLYEQPLASSDAPVIEPLEETVQRLVVDGKSERDRPILYRLRLEVSKSRLLLQMLHNEGFDAASMFPGYVGVTKSLQELRFHGPINYRDVYSTEG
jgi:hypothetical protein